MSKAKKGFVLELSYSSHLLLLYSQVPGCEFSFQGIPEHTLGLWGCLRFHLYVIHPYDAKKYSEDNPTGAFLSDLKNINYKDGCCL